MDIKILGKGCPKCQRLEELTLNVAAELGLEIRIEHIRDMARIMEYPVLSIPCPASARFRSRRPTPSRCPPVTNGASSTPGERRQDDLGLARSIAPRFIPST